MCVWLRLKQKGRRPPAVWICLKTKYVLDLAPQLVFDPSYPMAEDYGSIMELQGGSME